VVSFPTDIHRDDLANDVRDFLVGKVETLTE
jgi:hypothetical protein